MTRLVYRRNRKTAFSRVLSAVLAIVFTLSFTGVVHAVGPVEGVQAPPAEPAAVVEPEVVAPEPEPDVPEATESDVVVVAPEAEEAATDEGEAVVESPALVQPEVSADKTAEKAAKEPKKDKGSEEATPPADPGGYTTVSGNPALCEGGLKVDPARSGTFTHMVGDTQVEVTIDLVETDDGQVLSWSSDFPVDQVIVKGGPDANVYSYDGAQSGTGLHAPLNPSNKWADVSWVGFCFGDGGGGGGPGQDVGVIRVYKFCDADGDGEQDDGEAPLSGFTFHLMDGETTVDTAVTGEDGYAEFEPVTFGTYTVHEVPREGWQVTTPGGYVQTVGLESGVATVVFGNRPAQVVVPCWTKTFDLTIAGDVAVDVDHYAVGYVIGGVTTQVALTDVGGGHYSADIQVPDGTIIEEWVFYAVVDGANVALSALQGPETVTEEMTNSHEFTPGMVGGTKFIDADLDGAGPFDPDDTFGAGWTFVLEGPGLGDGLVTMSGASGGYLFDGLLPGTYTVRELDMPAFVQIHPVGTASVTLALAGMEGMVNFVNRSALTGVSVTKSVTPSTARPGDTVTWTILVENTGELMLETTELTDPLLDLLGVDVGVIMPGASYTATYDWVVPADASGTVVNEVTVVGQPSVGGPVTDSDTAELEIIETQVEKRFRLETVADLVPAPTAVEVDYVIDGQTTTVTLADQGAGVWLSGPLMLDWGTTISQWSVHAIVDGARWPTALFTSVAPETLTPEGPSPAVVNTATYVPGTIVGAKALDLDRDGTADAAPGELLSGWAYSLNGGWANDVSGSDGLFGFSGLLPGTYTITEAMTAEQAALYQLIAPVGGSQSVTVAAAQTVVLDTFVNQPVLPSVDITKSASVTTVTPGDTVTYTFTVQNTGPWTLFPVNVTDPMIPAVASQAIPALAPDGMVGDSFTFTADFVVPVDAPAGPLTNVATVVAEDEFGFEVSDSDSETVQVSEALPFTDIEVVKTPSVTEIAPGGTITYTLTYRNTGGGTIDGFTVVDDYPENLVTVVDAAGGTVADGTITWVITAPLGPGESRTVQYSVRVGSDVADGTAIDNVVTIPEFGVSDTARVIVDVEGFLPFTVSSADPFLPFTGGNLLGMLTAAFIALGLGLVLRRAGRGAVS